jgi:hypothetical protein
MLTCFTRKIVTIVNIVALSFGLLQIINWIVGFKLSEFSS